MTRTYPRRWAETLIIVGLLLMAMTAAAFAQDPTPTPSPEPTVVVTPTPTIVAELTPAPVATETATVAPTPTPTATATATETATPAPTATPHAPSHQPILVTAKPQPTHTARQSPTPPPDPTPTPPDEFTGASLTLCHFTDDPAQPYVPVVITADHWSDYFYEEFDIIPAPSSGCANITDPDLAANQDVTVCHLEADGSYSLHRYPPGDLGGHEGDKGDIIPAPNGVCPGDGGYTVVTPTPTSTPTATATATPDDGDPGDDGDDEDGGVAPASATSTPTPAAAVATTATTTSQLPFTGFDLWLIATAGLALTLMGAGLRLLAAQPPVGVTR